MRKIRLGQGIVHDVDVTDFMFRGRLTRPNGQFRAQVSALTRNVNSTWLEELASESNTIQAQEDISWSGMIAGNYQVKLCIFL